MTTPASDTSERPLSIKILLACGVMGPLLFIIVFLIAGATRPDYNPAYHFVSSLSQGELGWVQIANFLLCGTLVLCFAIGLKLVLRVGPGSLWGPILLIVFGLGLIGAGIFVADPILGYPPGPQNNGQASLQNTLHEIASMFVFASLPAATFVLARRFAKDPTWRGWTFYSILTGILVIVLFFAFSVAYELAREGTLPGAPVGLLQRLCIIVGWSWIALLALRLLNHKPPMHS